MKKTVIRMAMIAGLATCSTGCMVGNLTNPGAAPGYGGGMVYQEVTTPTVNYSVAENKDVKPLKRGEATVEVILGLVANGDASIQAAMKNGGITKVHHIDYKNKSVLGLLFSRQTVIVYGE
jgi:hypothetical protein